MSLLIAEGRTVIDVAGQAGHSPETCLRYYAHLFAEFDPDVHVSAENLALRPQSRRPDSNRGRFIGSPA